MQKSEIVTLLYLIKTSFEMKEAFKKTLLWLVGAEKNDGIFFF